MFTSIKTKEISLNQDEILISNLFLYIEKNFEEKILSYIKDESYQIWEIKDESGLTILHKSCFLNKTNLSISIIKEMKKRLGNNNVFIAFINSKTNEGLTPLHYTAFKGNLEISRYLLQNGADVNAVTNLGKNIIHLSAEGDQPAYMIYYLYKKVIDIGTQDNNKSTPLHWACYSGAMNSIKFLLSLGAEINALDKNELSPLHLAVLHNRKEIVIKLLQNGAIKDTTNTRGETPLYIAWKKNFKDIYNILNKNEFYPLWSIEEPYIFIEPKNIYKKLIIFIFIFQEFFIALMIFPFLRDRINYIINSILFVLDILLFTILIQRDPGYKKTDIRKIKNNNTIMPLHKYPLMNQIEKNIDIKQYCPICFVPCIKGVKHCIICKRCVSGFSHHCFWFNKCIGKKNRIIYIIFLVCTFLHCVYTIFICSNLIFDTVNIPYERFLPTWIYLGIDRGFRVLGANIVSIISVISSYPIFFMFMVEMFKLCGLLGKKNKDFENLQKEEKIETLLTDESKSIEMQNQRHDSLWSDRDPEENEDEEKNKINIPNKNFPIGVDRDTIQEEEKENIEDENENIIENNNEEENK